MPFSKAGLPCRVTVLTTLSNPREGDLLPFSESSLLQTDPILQCVIGSKGLEVICPGSAE